MKITRIAAMLAFGLLAAACAKTEEEAAPVDETSVPAPAPLPDSAAMDTTNMMMDTTTTTHN